MDVHCIYIHLNLALIPTLSLSSTCFFLVPIPVFSHDGHEEESPTARVLVHSWQVGVAKTTIFSADSEGSLHAWEWK